MFVIASAEPLLKTLSGRNVGHAIAVAALAIFRLFYLSDK